MLKIYHRPVPLSRNLGNLTSWNPLGHSRPVTGLIYLYLSLLTVHRSKMLICNILNNYSIILSMTYKQYIVRISEIYKSVKNSVAFSILKIFVCRTKNC